MEFELIIRKLENALTEEEKEIFDQWYAASPKNRAYFEKRKEYHLRHTRMPFAEKTGEVLEQDVRTSGSQGNKPQQNRQKLYRWLGVAASIVLLVSLGAYFSDYIIPANRAEVTIEPGSSKAVLTLGDGTQVVLDKGETYTSDNLSSDGESLIYGTGKEGAETYNELTVPRGGEFFVLLADSTRVWLNSETKIKYPDTFIDGQPRVVELLYGEAFFEVSPAAKHGGSTFKVATRNQEIEVLGTQFNISAYRGDKTVTSTLIEGKVMVSNGGTSKQLKPGEQSVVGEGSAGITITAVDVYNAAAWKEGLFGFENKSLKEVMEVLARWYDIEVEFRNKTLRSRRLGGMLSRRQSIQNILTALSATNEDLNFRVEGKKVIVE